MSIRQTLWAKLRYFFEYTTAGSAAEKWRSLWVRQSEAIACLDPKTYLFGRRRKNI
jgi:hypothetical protein